MGKHKRGKGTEEGLKRELIFKDEGQEYGQVLKMLGNGRCNVQCFDGVSRLCIIRGAMRKKIWVMVSDIVLVSLRDFQDEKGDIIVKYTADEARNLKNYKELPENTKINETDLNAEEEGAGDIEFGVDEKIADLADI